MSTRANIIIKENNEKLVFYRHSDGYPEGTMPTLELFLKWVKESKIRGNLSQSAGWLILIGAMEYNTIPKFETTPTCEYGIVESIKKAKDNGSTWKVGAYEPTTEIHGDIEYLYVIDLVKKEIKVHEGYGDFGELKNY